MGVQGLWDLLAPVGRRVSVETLAGKKLAIDASIWMVQFMKAMRDERGEMVRNAHLLGFFRRICKLLFLRTKPVFVFDGATPALKRRTVAARRRRRDKAQANIRKTAEKLLLNHLKAKRLEELAAEIKMGNSTKDGSKGKQVALEVEGGGGVGDLVGSNSGSSSRKVVGSSLNQESLDELLAASLAAEEETNFTDNVLGSARGVLPEEEVEGDDNDEIIVPLMSDSIDPAVLASLPPSMQLDLLVQMREKLMAENRQKYQKIRKAPEKFSELQIQSYLKTVAFRREIDEVQKCAAGKGFSGVQTSRIASEANREFIFSSSFTGDKQMFTSAGVNKSVDQDHRSPRKVILSDPIKLSSFLGQSSSASTVTVSEPKHTDGDDIETYQDERGRTRVSRFRGMGIHMTRDLQRNLDFMKEHEQENRRGNVCMDPETACGKDASDISRRDLEFSKSIKASMLNECKKSSGRISGAAEGDVSNPSDTELRVSSKETIEVTFLEDDIEKKDADENLFLSLVSGNPTLQQLSDSGTSDKSTNDFESECIWEEGVVEENPVDLTSISNEQNPSNLEEGGSSEDEMEWEEGDHAPEAASDGQTKGQKVVSRGLLEEEVDIEEAIRRSLVDFEGQKTLNLSSGNSNTNMTIDSNNCLELQFNNSTDKKSSLSANLSSESCQRKSLALFATLDGHEVVDSTTQEHAKQVNDSSGIYLCPPAESGVLFEGKLNAIDKTNERLQVLDEKLIDICLDDDDGLKMLNTDNALKTVISVGHQLSCTEKDTDVSELAGDGHNVGICTKSFAGTISNIRLDANQIRSPNQLSCTEKDTDVRVDAYSDHFQSNGVSQSSHFFQENNGIVIAQRNSLMEEKAERVVDVDKEREKVAGTGNDIPSVEGENFRDKTIVYEDMYDHIVVPDTTLDEEIQLLMQERIGLGDEQRKLERNAESVSSEMFAECQELLQMFGLPYIIAPMEAEAQCAYMESAKLVDGVITDDSDVFLFGARSVYKNIFDDRKYVETYFMKDIVSELGLTREKLIRMALLLGSDYTEGVSGIGIVNAIEVVRAFPEEDGLQKFRDWLESPDPSILGQVNSQTGDILKKKSSKCINENVDVVINNLEEHHDQSAVNAIPDNKELFMTSHRNISKNWQIPSSFPSESVISAYTYPQVDQSTEPFSWGKPDLLLLRKLCWERFGWNNQKADELIVPVLKEYDKHETQLRLEAFYSFNERFAKIRSQRIKKAIKGITGSYSSELTTAVALENTKPGNKRRPGCSTRKERKSENHIDSKAGNDKGTLKPRRRQKSKTHGMQTEDGAWESPTVELGGGDDKIQAGANTRESRRRGKGSPGRRGRRKEKPESESTSSETENHNQMPEETTQLRRSLRHRKHVEYAGDEVANLSVSPNVPYDCGSSKDTLPEEPSEHQPKIMVGDDYILAESQNQTSMEDGCPEDYLVSGGGFCMDDGDQLGDASQTGARPVRDLVGASMEGPNNVENDHGQDTGSVFTAQDQHATEKASPSAEAVEVGKDNLGLSAMPTLKRKRRKT